MSATYDINYDDERFTQVETDKQEALTDLEKTYQGMIGESDNYYQAQIDASKEWAEKQQQIQQDNTDFAIEQIEQQKDKANKDYIKEQSGAYKDWQKESNRYGANAEQMAASGLSGTGYSESSQVSMYNTYQNRVAAARESYHQAVLNYNNAIKDAQLQNNSALAEIAYNALQQQLELSLQGFQYKNQLILEQAGKKQELENTYYNRYQDVLNQMNAENALAEEIRQYNESLQLERDQLAEQIRQFDAEMARLKENDAKAYALELQQLELQKQQAQAQLEALRIQKTASTGSGSGSKGSANSTAETLKAAELFGTLNGSNQPKGIVGYGRVTNTGETVSLQNGTNAPIWKTPNGSEWYWDGSNYVLISHYTNTSGTKTGTATGTSKGTSSSKIVGSNAAGIGTSNALHSSTKKYVVGTSNALH